MGFPRAADSGVHGTVSDEAAAFLERGDITGLIEFHRSVFGDAVMAADRDTDSDSPEGSSEGVDESDVDDPGSEEGEDEPRDDDSDDDKNDESRDTDAYIQDLRKEAKRYRLRNREHRNEINDLKKRIEELSKRPRKDDSDADDEVPRLQQENTDLTRDRDSLMKENDDLRIRLAFVSHNKYAWQNPKAALRLADLSDVEIDEDGSVVGLEDALDTLARTDPYLLKKNEPEEKPVQKRRSGQPTGQSRSTNSNRDALLKKYPSLRR